MSDELIGTLAAMAGEMSNLGDAAALREGANVIAAAAERERKLQSQLDAANGPLYCDVCKEQLQREACNHVRPCHTCECEAQAKLDAAEADRDAARSYNATSVGLLDYAFAQADQPLGEKLRTEIDTFLSLPQPSNAFAVKAEQKDMTLLSVRGELERLSHIVDDEDHALIQEHITSIDDVLAEGGAA